ncbi:MAG: sodium ion-translocating decarboxylase subunit beta [Thermoplasmata archaeon]|nr:sodium ion-translocating decarboxylase subunit beta [Thermoplasmata archaeon]
MYETGLQHLTWQNIVMLAVGIGFLFLSIKKKIEPYELLPLGVGIILANLPLTGLMTVVSGQQGLLYTIYKYGILWTIFPTLIFVGLGAMTDFGPLIANPKTLILGSAAQIGIYCAFLLGILCGFTPAESCCIGIIGGADGPTTIYLTTFLRPKIPDFIPFLAVVSVAAYTYMAMVPIFQPPIAKALTTKEERKIKMKALRPVSKTEKILFPIIMSFVIILLVPRAGTLIGCFCFGNILRESGVVPRLSKTAQNELINLITLFLCLCIGASMNGNVILQWKMMMILGLGLIAICGGTAGGVLIAKLMNYFSKEKINPLIGAAGVSAVPMAARTVQKIALKEDPTNHILMHAMGPNIAGVIGSATAAGIFLGMLG